MFLSPPSCRELAALFISSTNHAPETAEFITDIKDVPVLAGALKSQAEFLITLDRKHFMSEKMKLANLPIKILTPKEFIENYLK